MALALALLLAAGLTAADGQGRAGTQAAEGSRAPDFWRASLYDGKDGWAAKFPHHPKRVRLPAGPLARALPSFVAQPSFREKYFEKLSVVLTASADESGTPILTPERAYDGGPYAFGPPTIGDPLFPKNVNFARSSFAKPNSQFQQGAAIGSAEIQAALGRGETVFFNDISGWEPEVARTAYGVAEALGLRTGVNAYMTAPGVATSMATHNDLQCTFIIQTSGVKHWKIWLKSATMLATDRRLTVGKQANTQVDVDRLGPPDLETDLLPGQVLYVPRGGLHHTSTSLVETTDPELTSVPSLHLTLGVNVIRTDPKVDGSDEAAALAKQFNHSVENTVSRLVLARSPVATASLESFYAEYVKAAEAKIATDPRFRRSLMYADSRATKATVKELLGSVVDSLLDSPGFLPVIAEEVNKEHEEWRAEHKAALEEMGEPYVAEPLLDVQPLSGDDEEEAGSKTCSADEKESWMGLKLAALMDVASEQGLSDDAIDEAMESDSPKEALVQELLRLTC